MTQTEIQSIHSNILKLIEARRAKEAIQQTEYLLQQIGFGPLYDRLRGQDNTYRYLLQYHFEGYADDQQGQVLDTLFAQLGDIADKAFMEWMSANGGGWIHELMHPKDSKSVKELAMQLVDTRQFLSEDLNDDELQKYRVRFDDCQKELFNAVLCSGAWQDPEEWTEAVISVDNDTQALLVSALLLSSLWAFDGHKLLLLMDLAANAVPKTSIRALTAVVLLADRYAARMALYPSIKARFSLLMEDAALVSLVYSICVQLIRERNVDDVNHHIHEDIMPEMNRFGTLLQKRFDEADKQSDDFDMEELFEQAHVTDKMQELQQMHQDGEDVYLGTFSRLKSMPFFKSISNWFLPFSETNAEVSKLFSSSSDSDKPNVIQLITRLGTMCDSDKYSFAYNLSQLPDSYRSPMTNTIGAEAESLYDMMKDEENGISRKLRGYIAGQYIQDLYRFFTIFPYRQLFDNVFEQPFDFLRNPFLSFLKNDAAGMEKVANAWVKTRHYVIKTRQDNCRRALEIYRIILESAPDRYDVLRRAGYCYEQLNELPSAIDYYAKADLVRPDNPWTLKHLTSCCNLTGRHEEALAYCHRWSVVEDKNLQASLTEGHTLMELKRYQEALNAYYKAEFISPDTPKTWRPIAWCTMLLGKLEQAEKYTERILSASPSVNDSLNAGHVAWLMGQRRQAVDRYVAGIRSHNMPVQDFLRLFDRDAVQLAALGIPSGDIPLVRDGIIYAMED